MAKKVSKTKQDQNQTPRAPSASQYALLRYPVVTEKTSLIGADRRRVCFRVPKAASKDEIHKAVEAVFGVQVEAVRTCNVLGKVKRTMRSIGRRPSFKKAYITLKEGQTIDLVEGV